MAKVLSFSGSRKNFGTIVSAQNVLVSDFFLRCLAAFLIVAPTVAAFSQASAEDEKPVFSVKTPYVEIEVRIAGELRAYPQLYTALLADAKKYADDNKKEALAAWRADRPSFRGQPWTFDRGCRLRAAADPYVSVLIDDGEFTGGAHPNTLLDTLLWDTASNRRADPATLFRETAVDGPTATALAALAALVRAAIIEEKKKRDVPIDDETDRWLEPIKPDLSTLGAPSLAPSTIAGHASGMTFHFSPYGIGPYAEGSYAIFVPFSALLPYLAEDAKKIFAGERPKSDEDE